MSIYKPLTGKKTMLNSGSLSWSPILCGLLEEFVMGMVISFNEDGTLDVGEGMGKGGGEWKWIQNDSFPRSWCQREDRRK